MRTPRDGRRAKSGRDTEILEADRLLIAAGRRANTRAREPTMR
jgi:hypothetical protein